jgi:hypothetical protein
MTSFTAVWSFLQSNLKPGMEIKNWTAFNGYLGDTMKIEAVRSLSIEVDAPKAASFQMVPKDDFGKVWEVWPEYKSHKLKRYELTDITRFTKYIISILYWYEEEIKHGRS